jgi:hypothetical protein
MLREEVGLKRFSICFCVVLFVCSLTLHASVFECASQAGSATVAVSPASVTAGVGQDFSVDINASGVSDLYGWEFKLGWNASLLGLVDVSEGPFLRSSGNTFFTYYLNTTDEHVVADCTLEGQIPGVGGNGTLATVMLHTANAGECSLNLYDPILLNSNEEQINCSTVGGYGNFIIKRVSSVVPRKTIVGLSYSLNVNVTVGNPDNHSETFNITLYANITTVGNITVTNLPNGTFTLITFVWDTTGFSYGNYTVSAYAWPVPGETDTSSNCTDGNVTITIPGDIDGDGYVFLGDLGLMAAAWTSTPGSPIWNPNADITDTGQVFLSSLGVMAQHWTESWTPP